MPPLTPLYPDTDGLPLLADPTSQYRKLKTDEERADQIVLAELLHGLKAPAYVGDIADRIAYGLALQVIFQLQQGVTPDITKSVSNAHPGNTTTYRDRYKSPEAAAIISAATGVKWTGFTVPPGGV